MLPGMQGLHPTVIAQGPREHHVKLSQKISALHSSGMLPRAVEWHVANPNSMAEP